MTVPGQAGDRRKSDATHLPKKADVDELIRWINEARQAHSDQPLADLLDSQEVKADLLVELACVDLIALRRSDRKATVEDYLQQFPALHRCEEHILDLVDAELCIRRELGDPFSISELTDRFPALADPIRQLAMLEGSPETPHQSRGDEAEIRSSHTSWTQGLSDDSEHDASATIDFKNDSDSIHGISLEPSASATFELAVPRDFSLERDMTVGRAETGESTRRGTANPARRVDRDDSIDVTIPIQPPSWMSGARCIATTLGDQGRCWLVKGRDIERVDSVAMKIMPVPAELDRETRTRMLDFCEKTSNVSHAAWIAPRIAAINNGHLAVIRPWVFGQSLAMNSTSESRTMALDALPTIGYALSAAHRTGATHGNVTAENIIVNHESKPCLVDAGSSVSGWHGYFPRWENDLARTLSDRIEMDAFAFLSVISSQIIHQVHALGHMDRLQSWISALTHKVGFDQPDACVQLGENLQGLLDGKSPPRRWWKT